MYRQYENPYEMEEQLRKAQEKYAKAVEDGVDIDDLIGMSEDIAELKERVNFAWQDEEFDQEQNEFDFGY